MRAHSEDPLTAKEYRDARVHLGLTQEQLAYETGATLSTIQKRESGETPVRREAQLAMRWLLANPPSLPPRHVILTRPAAYAPGDQFGLFTVVQVRSRGAARQPNILEIKCQCGVQRTVTAAKLSPRTTCRTLCPARTAMVARGSHVDDRGDIIDKDGYPES